MVDTKNKNQTKNFKNTDRKMSTIIEERIIFVRNQVAFGSL